MWHMYTFKYLIWSEWAHLLSHGPAKVYIPAPRSGAEDFDLAASRAKSKKYPSLCSLCLCLPRSSVGWYWGGEVAFADCPSTLPLGHELEAEWLRAVSLSTG
jgi:hypothetical protein